MKRYTPEQIVTMLREVETSGETIEGFCRRKVGLCRICGHNDKVQVSQWHARFTQLNSRNKQSN
jgi:anaerobic ribonucleoside-triphosphate reductase